MDGGDREGDRKQWKGKGERLGLRERQESGKTGGGVGRGMRAREGSGPTLEKTKGWEEKERGEEQGN